MRSSSSLRILIVADASPLGVASGGERVLWAQAAGLRRSGHSVRILGRAPAEGGPSTLEREGVRIRHFPVNGRSALRLFGSSILAARRAAAAALVEEGADVLHLHQPLSGYGVLRSSAGRKIPSLYTLHSPAPLEYRVRRGMSLHHRRGWIGNLATALLWFLEGACLRRAGRIHVLSEYSAGLLRKLYRIPAERIVRIPGGVDVDRFRPAADRGALRSTLGLPAEVPLVFTLRNLEARMGVDALLRAIALLRQRGQAFLLLIGGDGPIRGRLESLSASLGLGERVRFLGFIPEEQLSAYYQVADVFALPSQELEGFGLVTVEALACGTPVLGTPAGATPEILGPLDPALLLRDVTPEAIAEGLQHFLEGLARDPTRWGRLREECRRYAETRYTWTQAVARLEDTLTELAAGGAAEVGGA